MSAPLDYGTSEYVAGVYLAGPPPAQRSYSLENPNLPLNDPAVWDAVFGDSFGTDVGINITAEKALMYAPLYRGVQLISGDVAKLPRYVYKRRSDISEDARERDRGHRLNYVLNVASNEYTEAIKFWCRFMVDALLYQNAYARIYFDGAGNVAELYNLLPDRTAPEWIDGRLWYVTEAGGKLHPLHAWEVLHIEGLALGGVASALFRMARNSIALGLAQEKFSSKFFANGGRVGGVLELPLGMPKNARDSLEEGFRKTYEGADNPFKTVILRDNAKFHAAQQSPQDSQMVEATEAQTRAIAHWLNLAPSKLGLSDSVSYNSKTEDNQDYLDTTLQIWLTRIESACNFRMVSDRQSDSHFIEHSVKNLLRMNPLQMADMHQKQIASRIINPNEARADLNKLPYEGGDEYVNPNTLKAGSPDGEKPKEDEPADEPKPEENPKRSLPDAAFLRVVFGITASAREKAKNPNALVVWVDGDLAKHRAEWSHLWGERPFPFDMLVDDLKRNLQVWTKDELAQRVEEWCAIVEAKEWNAE